MASNQKAAIVHPMLRGTGREQDEARRLCLQGTPRSPEWDRIRWDDLKADRGEMARRARRKDIQPYIPEPLATLGEDYARAHYWDEAVARDRLELGGQHAFYPARPIGA